MLLSKKFKCVYVAIPKTGTHSVWSVLQEHFGFFAINITGGTGSGYHDDRVVDGWNSFATIRNPYTRAFSLWNQYGRAIPVDTFLTMLARRELAPLYSRTQSQWLRHGSPEVVKGEAMEAGFNAMKWATKHESHPFTIPRLHEATYEAPELTRDRKRIIQDWAGEDFERFGYLA